MSCPVCVGACHCGRGDEAGPSPVAEHVSVLIDPEHCDPSEERFADSLAGQSAGKHLDVATELEASARAAKVEALLKRSLLVQGGEATLREKGQDEDSSAEWRREVSSRVNRFRNRKRPRGSRSRSLALDFAPAPVAASIAVLEPEPEPTAEPAHETFVLPEYQPTLPEIVELHVEGYGLQRYWPQTAPRNDTPYLRRAQPALQTAAVEVVPEAPPLFDGGTLVRLAETVRYVEMINSESQAAGTVEEQRVESKVIEFPRSAPAPWGEELAEPVVSSPRIFEAEEVAQAEQEEAELAREFGGPPLPSIVLEAPEEPEPLPQTIELPLPLAPMGLRLIAMLLDVAAVAGASLLFGIVLLEMHAMPDGRAGTFLTLFVPLALWAFYQYLFLTSCGLTPGMAATRLELMRFDRVPVSRAQLALRAASTVLSTLALGLGFAWALVDEDRLTWHDRMTHSCVVVPELPY